MTAGFALGVDLALEAYAKSGELPVYALGAKGCDDPALGVGPIDIFRDVAIQSHWSTHTHIRTPIVFG